MRIWLPVVAIALCASAVPGAAVAAVTVAEPIGDVEPELLADLHGALEQVVREISPAPTRDAELRVAATSADDAVALILELAPTDGTESFREARTASRASALAQARAMARSALRMLAAPPPAPPTPPANGSPPEEPARHDPYRGRLGLAALLGAAPYFLTIGVGCVVFGFANEFDDGTSKGQTAHGEDPEVVKELKSREHAEVLVTKALIPLGVFSALGSSIMMYFVNRREGIFGIMLGSYIGLALEIGLMSALYFGTETAAALLAPTAVAYVILPVLGGVTGARIETRHGRRGVAFSPPAPIALGTPAGRAAPGLAFGGTF